MDLFSGLEERLEIELVRNLRLEIETYIFPHIFDYLSLLLGELFFFYSEGEKIVGSLVLFVPRELEING